MTRNTNERDLTQYMLGAEITVTVKIVTTDKRQRKMVFFDFPLTVKAAPHECVIRTGQP